MTEKLFTPFTAGEIELRNAWKRASALARRLGAAGLHPSDYGEFGPFTAPAAAVGMGRWLFESLARGLPRLGAPLPTREAQPAYWAHLDGLLRTSSELAKLARVRSSNAALVGFR